MGTYTKLELTAAVNDSFKEIEHLFTDEALNPRLTDEERAELWRDMKHEFFRLEYADNILTHRRPNGGEHPAMRYENGTITVDTLIRNYHSEIQEFLKWITPYLKLETVKGSYNSEGMNWIRPAVIVVDGNKIRIDSSDSNGDRGFHTFGYN